MASGRRHQCPVPGCGWFWESGPRPVGQGEEFERRLAALARITADALVEHRREQHPELDRPYLVLIRS